MVKILWCSFFNGYKTFGKNLRWSNPWLKPIPSGERLHFAMERSTMLLMGKSTKFLWPFSIAFCMFTRGYILKWCSLLWPFETPQQLSEQRSQEQMPDLMDFMAPRCGERGNGAQWRTEKHRRRWTKTG